LQDKDTVWLSIISSAKGKQGYSTPKEAKADKERFRSNASHILLDEKGKVGMAYGAKTTPHMFIVDKKGMVVYEGAIDSINSYKPEDIPKAKNFIKLAKNDIKNGQKIKFDKTKPYGCSVKY
jgi:hypothetical protein